MIYDNAIESLTVCVMAHVDELLLGSALLDRFFSSNFARLLSYYVLWLCGAFIGYYSLTIIIPSALVLRKWVFVVWDIFAGRLGGGLDGRVEAWRRLVCPLCHTLRLDLATCYVISSNNCNLIAFVIFILSSIWSLAPLNSICNILAAGTLPTARLLVLSENISRGWLLGGCSKLAP